MASFPVLSVVMVVMAVFLGLFLRTDHDKVFLRMLPYNETTSYQGQVVWITGASTGIGAALVFDMCKAGAQTVVSARQRDKLEEVAKKCTNQGHLPPLILPFDVLVTEEHAVAYAAIKEKFGKLDVLVLNPGRSQRKLAVDTTLEETRSLFDLNFFSYVSLSRAVLPDMIARGAGQLVVVSSISGKIGTPVASTYSATKYALQGYFDALRAEVQHLGVHVSLICPGPVVSELLGHVVRDAETKADDGSTRMPTERCTDLMARGIHHKIDELWISDQPLLGITFLNVYFPWVGRQLFTRFVGPSRSRMLKEGNKNMYSLLENLGLKK
jgi:short-subunit dehydrogenase